MTSTNCPVCFTALEVRQVAPCFICGGWPNALENLPSQRLSEWRLPNNCTIVLCEHCMLDDFMRRGGLGEKLGLIASKFPIQELQLVNTDVPKIAINDKFCPTCNCRWALLRLLATQTQSEV